MIVLNFQNKLLYFEKYFRALNFFANCSEISSSFRTITLFFKLFWNYQNFFRTISLFCHLCWNVLLNFRIISIFHFVLKLQNNFKFCKLFWKLLISQNKNFNISEQLRFFPFILKLQNNPFIFHLFFDFYSLFMNISEQLIFFILFWNFIINIPV